MKTNGSPGPTPQEWAAAKLLVDRYDGDGGPVVFEFKKSITKAGRKFRQSVWLTLEQLQAVARDHCG